MIVTAQHGATLQTASLRTQSMEVQLDGPAGQVCVFVVVMAVRGGGCDRVGISLRMLAWSFLINCGRSGRGGIRLPARLAGNGQMPRQEAALDSCRVPLRPKLQDGEGLRTHGAMPRGEAPSGRAQSLLTPKSSTRKPQASGHKAQSSQCRTPSRQKRRHEAGKH